MRYNYYSKRKKKGAIIMRLWHRDLLPLLDRQRLLAQHRECAALRGLGWGKKTRNGGLCIYTRICAFSRIS